jgi:hypothetical protein
MVCKPGYLRWWWQNRVAHNPEFIAYVDDVIAADCE